MSDTKRRRIRIRLKEIRERFKLTQKQLADAAGIRQATVSSLELGSTSVSFETLERLCNALDLEPGELFEIEPQGKDWRPPPALEKYYAEIARREHEDIMGRIAVVETEMRRARVDLADLEMEQKKRPAKKGKKK